MSANRIADGSPKRGIIPGNSSNTPPTRNRRRTTCVARWTERLVAVERMALTAETAVSGEADA
ncbi:MAG: hypothetical protein ABJB74_11235 [Gemmatimonas sp.]